jgi:TP901 family phage tail tape measure protein
MKFTETATKMAMVSELSAEEAAVALAKIANATGTPIIQVDRLASVIDQLDNTMAASSREIIQGVLNMASLGGVVGATVPQMASLSAALVSMGMSAGKSGTLMARVFQEMSNKSSQMAAQMGVDAQEFSQKVSTNIIGALLDYLRFIDQVSDRTRKATLMTEIFGAIGSRATGLLAENTDVFIKALGIANDEWERNTALARDSELVTKGLNAQIELLKNSMSALWLESGPQIISTMQSMVTWMRNLTEAASSFKEAQKDVPSFWEQTRKTVLSALGPLGMALEFRLEAQKGFKMKTERQVAEDIKASQTTGGTQAPPIGGKNLEELNDAIISVDEYRKNLKDVIDQYVAGTSSLQDYYDTLDVGMSQEIAYREQAATLQETALALNQLMTDSEFARNEVTLGLQESLISFYQLKAELDNQDIANQQAKVESMTALMQTIQTMQLQTWTVIFDFINMGIKKFSSGMSTALSSIILGTQKAGEAFKKFGQSMITAIVEFFVQWAVQSLIGLALQKMITKWSMTQAKIIADAWALPAFLVSVATEGAAVAAGGGALIAGAAIFQGLVGASKSATGDVGSMGTGEDFSSAVLNGKMAYGGLISEPTMMMGMRSGQRYLAGEAGPEAIVPMNERSSVGVPTSSPITIAVNINTPFSADDRIFWDNVAREHIVPAIERNTDRRVS